MTLPRRARSLPGLARTVGLLPAPVRLILASMVLFNLGFYLVVPFLAVHMADDLHLAGAAIGLVLGLRTASQQGLFFLGGSLADRFGVRPVVLTGIAVRVVGFLVLGFAADLAWMIVGVLLVGVAAAMFAPAVEAADAAFGHRLERDGVIPRTELFALEQMCSRVGTVVGPALGALLLGVPFVWTAVAAAVLFAGLWVAFARWLPVGTGTGRSPAGPGPTLPAVWGTVLRNRSFVVFSVLCGMQLVAYNQLYLMLPEHLDRVVGSHAALGWFYTGAAVLVIAGQRPLVALARRLGYRPAIVAGLAVIAVSFLVPPLLAQSPAAGLAGLAAWVALLHVGQMLMVPPMRDAIGGFAAERLLGAHFGLLNTIGGMMTLIGSYAVGGAYDRIDAAALPAAVPWLAMAAAVAAATGVLAVWSRRRGLSPSAGSG